VNQKSYNRRRRKLWDLFFDEYRSQYINYRKYYLASDVLGKRGNILDYLTTVFSAILLAIIGAIASLGTPEWYNILLLILAAITSGLSIINTFGQWQLKSNEYYNAGQQHQELFKEIEYFVEVELPDENEEITYLENRAQELINKKNNLNKATPQLHTKWFDKLKKRRDIDWNQPTLEELREGEYDFH